ncbi:MAG: ORF6N domain-containing protein [Ferruginibacter sp.]
MIPEVKIKKIMPAKKEIKEITDSSIVNKIYIIRGQKVMLDKDLAEIYGVETFRLNEAVKRNSSRFPPDFMFQLTQDEFKSMISQNAISNNTGRGGTRKLPNVFTEQGVAMLSSVLNSETSIQVNIQIIRVFTKMKQLIFDYKDLFQKIEKIEQKLTAHDEDIHNVFIILKKLLQQPQQIKPVNRKPIGFPYPNKK